MRAAPHRAHPWPNTSSTGDIWSVIFVKPLNGCWIGSIQQLLQAMCRDKDLKTAYTLTQRFRHMMRAQTATALKPWLADGLASGMPELVNFADGLQREQPAVQAALTLPYSNGQVEGQITKLKLLKRQSYERAKLDPLRQRMLYAAWGASG